MSGLSEVAWDMRHNQQLLREVVYDLINQCYSLSVVCIRYCLYIITRLNADVNNLLRREMCVVEEREVRVLAREVARV